MQGIKLCPGSGPRGMVVRVHREGWWVKEEEAGGLPVWTSQIKSTNGRHRSVQIKNPWKLHTILERVQKITARLRADRQLGSLSVCPRVQVPTEVRTAASWDDNRLFSWTKSSGSVLTLKAAPSIGKASSPRPRLHLGSSTNKLTTKDWLTIRIQHLFFREYSDRNYYLFSLLCHPWGGLGSIHPDGYLGMVH